MSKRNQKRGFYYGLGMLILTLGRTLNSQSGLGVSPIISIAYSFATFTDVTFPDAAMYLYLLFVLIEMGIHYLLKVKKSMFFLDILQIPFSIVFTRFMQLYLLFIPAFSAYSLFIRIFILLIAIVCTGIGVAMTLKIRLIPNPGDGLEQALADVMDLDAGLMKNIVDISCICITMDLDFLFIGYPVGIGIGTILAMLLTGRCIALFHTYTDSYFDAVIYQ